MPTLNRRDDGWIAELRRRLSCKVVAVMIFGSTALMVILIAIIYHSILKDASNSSPLLQLHPHCGDDALPLIHVDGKGKWRTCVEKLDEFIHSYDPGDYGFSDCHSFRDRQAAPDDHSCFFDTTLLGECGLKGKSVYGYNFSQPCLYLNPNKLNGWEPDYYRNITEVPKEAPKELLNVMKEAEEDGELPPRLWISCQGKNPADKEYMGTVEYLPHQYFASYYFPYKEGRPYLAPVVALHFKTISPGVLVQVICRAWAKNIESMRPSIQWEMLID